MSKHQVVVAYDFSPHGDVALQRAIELAAHEPDNVLHFVTVIDTNQDYQTADSIQQDLLTRLRAIFDARQPPVEVDFFVHVRIGAPVAEVLSVAQDVGADLVICGSHGRGAVGRLLLGSVSQAILHGALCPVLIVRHKGYPYVALDKVTEVTPEGRHRARPHRYAYTSAQIQTRPSEWPIS